MNFFFGLKTRDFISQLTIPRFKNKSKPDLSYLLFKGDIKKNIWNFSEVNDCDTDSKFYYLNEKYINNNSIYFLAKKSEIKNISSSNKILNFNSFTDTDPRYRANFKILYRKSGISSYQSEYPFSMIKKKGSILSSIYALTNMRAENNYLIFRNIYEQPISEKFIVYLINIKLRKIVKKYYAYTNYSNIFNIDKKFIHPEIYFYSNKYLGIPIYLSQLNLHLSLEHTHPPHEYILDETKFEQIKKIKSRINEIIN